MKYFPQSLNACLAYAALSIGMVDREAVDMYEKALRAVGGYPTVRMQDDWMANYAPWLSPVMSRVAAGVVGRYVKDIQPMNGRPVGTGIGIIVADGGGYSINHALAHSRGKWLDPEPDAPGKPETWEELKARYESEGYTDAKLIDYARAL